MASWPLLLLLLSAPQLAAAQDPHSVLGVRLNAPEAEIRKAYRTAALRWHPDKNYSPDAMQRWLQVQQAYEALTAGASGGWSGGSAANPASQQQQQQRRASWQRFWQQPRHPPHIPSGTEELSAGTFFHHVLLSEGSGARHSSGPAGSTHHPGLPWLIQIFDHSSPYCRVLSTHWEEAAKEMEGLVHFARVDFTAQGMLVRFLASHLSLFSTSQPSQELPLALGFPAGCSRMQCARLYQGRFTAAGLQQFAATQLLRLPPLPPLSPRLLRPWLKAAAAVEPGGVALLVLLPEGQQQPAELLGAVARARTRGLAAAGVTPWRPADRSRWAELVGATSGPALIFWRGDAAQPAAVVQASLLTNSIRWAAEVEQHTWQPLPQLHAASAGQQLPACQPGLPQHKGGNASSDLSGPAYCMVLLGRGLPLAESRAALETALGQLASGGRGGALSGRPAWGKRSPVLRQAAQLLADGRVQAAWADARQQHALCAHLLRWSGSSSEDASCMCMPWWRRLPAVMLGQCSGQRNPQPTLVAYRQHSQGGRSSSAGGGRSLLQLAAYGGSVADVEQLAAWLTAVGGNTRQLQPKPLQMLRLAPLLRVPLAEASPAVAATLAVQLLHLASWGELLWQRAARTISGVLGGVKWDQVGVAVLLGAGLLALKWALDFLSGSEDGYEEGGASPAKASSSRRGTSSRCGTSTGVGRGVQEMQLSDWEPSPGRFLVVLLLQGESGSCDTGGCSSTERHSFRQPLGAQQAQQRFASLAAVFQQDRRVAFRTAPVSSSLGQLMAVLNSGSTSGADAGLSTVGSQSLQQLGQTGGQREGHWQPAALVLHPRRGGRFQVLQLAEGMQQAVLQVERVLDGGGRWLNGAPNARHC